MLVQPVLTPFVGVEREGHLTAVEKWVKNGMT